MTGSSGAPNGQASSSVHRRFGPFSLSQVTPAVLGLLLAVACSTGQEKPAASTDPAPAACAPACGARTCGDDGCGGSCGACAADQVCAGDGRCEACTETCAEAGVECGERCGVSCGACPAGQACAAGACVCEPTCNAATCGLPDGCGGTCGACALSDTSCPTCGLKLRLLQRREEGGVTRSVLVALSYVSTAQAARPLLADVRLRISGPGHLTGVGVSPMILETGKELRADAATGLPYTQLDDGSTQILVWSPGTLHPLADGDWLFFDVALDAAASAPVELSLVPREGILAPEAADQTLWGTAIATPLVIWAQ